MRETARTIVGLVLVGVLAAGGCSAEKAEPEAPAAEPAAEAPAEPLRTTEPDPNALGVEGTLPDDVPVPEGAKALHPPMVASGATRASYEVGDPIATVQAFYKTRLADGGWSISAEKDLDAQSLISANKGGRELSIAMSETAGRTQLVLLLIGG